MGEPLVPGRRVLVVQCVTEITSWGVLYYYYAFPVLAGGRALRPSRRGAALADVLGGYHAVFLGLAATAVLAAAGAAGAVPRPSPR